MQKLIEVLPTFKDQLANEKDMAVSGVHRTNTRLNHTSLEKKKALPLTVKLWLLIPLENLLPKSPNG